MHPKIVPRNIIVNSLVILDGHSGCKLEWALQGTIVTLTLYTCHNKHLQKKYRGCQSVHKCTGADIYSEKIVKKLKKNLFFLGWISTSFLSSCKISTACFECIRQIMVCLFLKRKPSCKISPWEDICRCVRKTKIGTPKYIFFLHRPPRMSFKVKFCSMIEILLVLILQFKKIILLFMQVYLS